MSPQHPLCRAIEPDLLSVAAGEAGSTAAGRVEAHVAGCGLCRDELGALPRARRHDGHAATRPARADDDATLARAQLASRLVGPALAHGGLRDLSVAAGAASSSAAPSRAWPWCSTCPRTDRCPRTCGGSWARTRSRTARRPRRCGRSWWSISRAGARGSTGRSTCAGCGAISSVACSRRRPRCPTARSPRTRASPRASGRPPRCARSRRRCAGTRCRSSSRATG